MFYADFRKTYDSKGDLENSQNAKVAPSCVETRVPVIYFNVLYYSSCRNYIKQYRNACGQLPETMNIIRKYICIGTHIRTHVNLFPFQN